MPVHEGVGRQGGGRPMTAPAVAWLRSEATAQGQCPFSRDALIRAVVEEVVVAAVNLAIPWSPVAMSELVALLGPAVQGAARQISARVV